MKTTGYIKVVILTWVIFVSCCAEVLAEAGDLVWKFEMEVGLEGINSSPAIGADGSIYFCTTDGYLYSLKNDGSMNWRYKISSNTNYMSPSIGYDGTIYVGANVNGLYAFNPDGSVKWQYVSNGSVNSSPAIGMDGTLYFTDNSLNALNSDGSLKWSISGISSMLLCSPALGNDGTIYIGSGGVSQSGCF